MGRNLVSRSDFATVTPAQSGYPFPFTGVQGYLPKNRHAPVSGTFPIDDREDRGRLFDKLALLAEHGLRQGFVSRVLARVVEDTLERQNLPAGQRKVLGLRFQARGKGLLGFFVLERTEAGKWQVELVLPKKIAEASPELWAGELYSLAAA